MPKDVKKWVKPGFLAANLAYEKQREKNINENKQRLEALGLTRFPASFNGSDHPKCKNKKGKTILGDTHSDDDYIPSDNGDEKSFDSLEHEVSEMPPARRLKFSEPSVSQPVQERDAPLEGNNVPIDMSVHDDVGGSILHIEEMVDSVSEPRANSEPRVSSDGSSTNRRGPSRGLRADLRIEKEGKLPVLIPTEFRQPVGPYATTFAAATGVQIRRNLQRPGVRRWSKVPETSVLPIVQRLNDKFNVQGNEVVVQKVTKAKCGSLLSGWSHRLYKHYKKLRETKSEEYARNHHPKSCNRDQWIDLIDNKWNDPKFLHQSAVNSANRSHSKTNHSCSSRSFAIRAHKLLEENRGVIDMPEFYHSCHFSKAKNNWVNSNCETVHENMIKFKEDHRLQPNAKPLSAEDISVQCLGVRSGIVKGLGMRPSSSSRSTATSDQDSEHVKSLEKNMEETIAQIQSKSQSRIQEMAAQMASLYQWAQRHGFDGPEDSSGPRIDLKYFYFFKKK